MLTSPARISPRSLKRTKQDVELQLKQKEDVELLVLTQDRLLKEEHFDFDELEPDSLICVDKSRKPLSPSYQTSVDVYSPPLKKRFLRSDPHQENVPELVSFIKDRSISGLSAQDYSQRMLATLRLYKWMSTGERNPVHRPFLHRNLMYINAYKRKVLPRYLIGQDEPPIVWPYPAKTTTPELCRLARVTRLNDVVMAIRNIAKLQAEVRKSEFVDNFKFKVATLALYTRQQKKALYNDISFRARMRKLGEIPPPRTPTYYSQIREHAPSESPHSCGATSASDQSTVQYHSLVFKSLRHKLVGGERIAKVLVYLVEQIGDAFQKPKRLPSSCFSMGVNLPSTTVFIDLPRIEPQDGQLVHLLLRVDISCNQNEVSVEGRSLRNTPSRASVLSPSPLNTDKLKDSHRQINWEYTYYGSRSIYNSSSDDQGGSYRSGEINITLIEQDVMDARLNDPCLIPELQLLSKKMHTNPFMQLSLGIFSLAESESDSEEISSEKGVVSDIDIISKEKLGNGVDYTEEEPLTEEESKMWRTALDVYTGRFKWDEKGVYVNDRKMIDLLFRSDVLRDKRQRDLIRDWLPLLIPSRIVYRLLCLDAEAQSISSSEEDEVSSKTPIPNKVQSEDLEWCTKVQEEKVQHCIICDRSFPNMFSLMMHYHTNYPRLTFLFNTQRDLYSKEDAKQVMIDVSLDPDFTDVMEVKNDAVPTKRLSRWPNFLVTRDQTRALRSQFRMDLTLFCQPIRVPELLDEETVLCSRYVDTICGRHLNLTENCSLNPQTLPQPSYDPIVRRMNEHVLDFIDIDEKTKRYMCTWNKMTIAIGRGNQSKSGSYMQHRLFLSLFGEHMKESKQTSRFFAQLVDEVERGALSPDEHYDLCCRLRTRDYNPIEDMLCSLTLRIFTFAKKQHRKFVAAMSTTSNPSSTRRSFHRIYRKDPASLSKNERNQLFRFILEQTEAVSKIDPRRNFLIDPFDLLFCGKVQEVLKDITPV